MTNLKLNILKLNKLKLFGLAVLFCGPWVAPISSASWTKQSDDTLKVEVGAINPNFNFQVKAPGGNSAAFAKFMPNTVTKLSLGMSYRNLGLSTSFAPAPSDERRVKYGNSSGSDFQFRFYGKRTYEIYHQAYQGFYIQNSDQLDPAYAKGGFIQRPDVRTSNTGINMYWSLDEERFSQAVAFDQAGLQTSSDWGLSWLAHLSQSTLEANSPLIPIVASNQFGALANLQHIHRNALAVGMAIGGIAQWNGFYITGLIGLGIAGQDINSQLAGEPDNQNQTGGTYVSGRVGLGHNGPKHVFGLQFLNDGVTTPLFQGEVQGTTVDLKMFYAYRFDGIDFPPLNPISAWLN